MRPASEVERRRLNEEFADLCRIRSVSGEEAAIAARVADDLRAIGVEVEEPDAAGNVLARIGGRDPERTRPALRPPRHGAPRRRRRAGRARTAAGSAPATRSSAPTTRPPSRCCWPSRAARPSRASPVGVELLFTTREETALRGAKAFDVGRLRSHVRLRLRPRLADRRGRRRLADLLPPRGPLPRRRRPRRHPPRGRPQRDRRRRAGDQRDAPRPDRRGDDRQRRRDRGRPARGDQRRARARHVPGRGAQPRRGEDRGARRRDGRPRPRRRQHARRASATSTSSSSGCSPATATARRGPACSPPRTRCATAATSPTRDRHRRRLGRQRAGGRAASPA